MGMSALEYTDYQELLYSGVYKLYTSMRILPSESLMALYDHENDLRYNQFFAKGGALEYGLEGFGDNMIYRKFFDANTYYDILPEASHHRRNDLGEGRGYMQTGRVAGSFANSQPIAREALCHRKRLSTDSKLTRGSP